MSEPSFCEIRGARVVRHLGDPIEEYESAANTVAIRDRSHRARLSVEGKEPLLALQGILTARMPIAPTIVAKDVWQGSSFYSAVLTPKARVVTDLNIMWGVQPEREILFLDVPYIGITPLTEYLGRVLPPRLARINDISEKTGLLTLMGPEAAEVVVRLLSSRGSRVTDLSNWGEGDYVLSQEGETEVRIVKTMEVLGGGWNVFASRNMIEDLWTYFLGQGIQPVGASVWEILRVEGGVPAFGQDVGDSTLFPETGLVDKAIDHNKGCYTGQEVIVRVRDRGRVNRLLCGFHLHGDIAPRNGEVLLVQDRKVGWLTTIVESPRAGGLVALGYLRQDLAPNDIITVGAPTGPEVKAVPLGPDWLSY